MLSGLCVLWNYGLANGGLEIATWANGRLTTSDNRYYTPTHFHGLDAGHATR